jgi:hypothetical protein
VQGATDGARTGWIGYIKRGRGRWQVLCSGDTYDQCWRRLLEFGGGQGLARLVLQEGKRP